MTLFWIRSRQVRIILPDPNKFEILWNECVCDGCVMGVCWVCDECEMVMLCVFECVVRVMGMWWVCYGEWLVCDGYVMSVLWWMIGVWWVCDGCVMGVWWVCVGCVMGVRWFCYAFLSVLCVGWVCVRWVCDVCLMGVCVNLPQTRHNRIRMSTPSHTPISLSAGQGPREIRHD